MNILPDDNNKLNKSKPKVELSAADTIKARYDTLRSTLFEYADHLHITKNLSQNLLLDEVMVMADSLVEEFHLGGNFLDECNAYVVRKFYRPVARLSSNIMERSKVDESNVEAIFDDLKQSESFKEFDSTFRNGLV